MAFPSNPSPGDQATVGGRLYRWDGAVWSFLEAVSPHAATHASGGGDAITIDAGQVSGGTLAANLLPAATTSSRGAVQVGSGLAVAGGTISANVVSVAGRTGTVAIAAADVSGLAAVATTGSYADLSNKPSIPAAYSLPVATASVLGGVKQGANTTITADGVISVAAPVTSLAATSITGLANIAKTGSASDLASGTVSRSLLPFAASNAVGVVQVGSGLQSKY